MISVIISLNTLVMHVTKIIFSFSAKLDKLITTIGVITIGTGMLGTTETVMIIKKTSVFIERTRDYNYIYFSFLNVNHAGNDLNFYELRVSFCL